MNIKLKDIKKYINKEVELSGFVETVRNLQYVQFIVLKDETGKLQITIEKSDESLKDIINTVNELTNYSTIKVTGKIVENENVKLRGVELIPTKLEITSKSLEELPIDIKNKDKALRETRLDYRFLDLRRDDNYLLFKAQTTFEHALREFCVNNDFIEIHSPKITKAAAESGAEVFKLDYFGQEATLAQSPQFYKQMAMASGFNKVFEIGPAFRAENSHTSYHATEINMVDIELSWIKSFEEVMDFEEEWLKYSIKKMYDKHEDDIKELFNVEFTNLDVPFFRITLEEAKKILKEKYNFVSDREDDLEREEEKLLCNYAKENYNTEFVFITKYPFSARPFYHMLDEDGITNSFDLLFRGVEITTGAQREHRYEILKKQIIKKGVDPEELDFYLEFFKYGCPPHGGFAIGVARVMMQLFEIDNIREATFIYRGPTRIEP